MVKMGSVLPREICWNDLKFSQAAQGEPAQFSTYHFIAINVLMTDTEVDLLAPAICDQKATSVVICSSQKSPAYAPQFLRICW